jgi:hypothetical protein
MKVQSDAEFFNISEILINPNNITRSHVYVSQKQIAFFMKEFSAA